MCERGRRQQCSRKLPPPRFETPKLDPSGCVQEALSEARFGANLDASWSFGSTMLQSVLHNFEACFVRFPRTLPYASQVRYVLQFTKPIYHMIKFADSNRPIIWKVYEQMDSMLGYIKDIVEPRDVNLYNHIRVEVEKRWEMAKYSTTCLSICSNT
jgi:hypothetical protein